ncbi:MAG TPA: lytic transglycosylase domain-containing protein [Pyrinomonadaceae bacterium]|jgi:soluble lytic murein transglycosylase-like protein|nr:lytic transglycosylase domain-containing protein [Pyrinomonadaceae bacterium]
MKKIPLVFALMLMASASAAAQNASASYRFDNFDVPGGVRIVTPPAPAPRAPRGKLKLTARTAASGSQASVPAPAQTSRALRSSEVSPAVSTAPTLSMADASALDGFSTGDANVDRYIVDSGTRNGVDPVLLYAIMHRESSFKRNALSPKGARGLMQLMPGTAARFGVTNIFDPRQNIEGGARYVRILLDMFDGDVRLALAGYNAGEGAVLKYGRRVPPYAETQEYVRRISERYELMRDPSTARRAPRVSRTQIAKLKASEPQTLVYERSVYAVRTPDGKLRLVSQ